MRSKVAITSFNKICSGGQNFDHEIKSLKSIITLLSILNLVNNLLASSAIMRSKISKFIKLHLWLIFSPNYCISHQCIKTFDLIIVLVTNKFFMRSKVKKMLFRLSISWSYWWLKNCSWDWKSKIMFFWTFDLMKNAVIRRSKLNLLKKWLLISWLFFQSYKKTLKFDLMMICYRDLPILGKICLRESTQVMQKGYLSTFYFYI
jgi:hypothetical protein